MSVNFNPSNLRRKSVLKDTSGNIINLLDETDGGWIVRGRQVVNQAKYDELVKKEHDKNVASKAVVEQVVAPKSAVDSRAGITPLPPTVTPLEKRVNDMENKLDQILNALKK